MRVPTLDEVLKLNPKLLKLHPNVQPFFVKHVQEAYRRDVPIRYYDTHRTFDQQFELFKKGRALVGGEWIVVDPKKVVTNVRKFGWHTVDPTTGVCAGDFALLIGLKQVTWDKGDRDGDGVDDWYEAADAGRSVGLNMGFFWKKFVDGPHAERHQGLDMEQAITRYEQGLDVVTGSRLITLPA